VTDFLEYARRARPQLAPVPLGPLLEEVVEVAGLPGGPTAKIVGPGELQVLADRAQLRRALINLVRNAFVAAGSAPGAQVVLAAQVHGERPRLVSIEVRDSGAGVPPPLREKIFEPFFTTREKGTGLGLAFVREIVRDHGGDIAVDQAPEGGARFTFDLPAA
jgi:signal transduction histidine kinase